MAAMAMLLNTCRVVIAKVPLQRVGGEKVSGSCSKKYGTKITPRGTHLALFTMAIIWPHVSSDILPWQWHQNQCQPPYLTELEMKKEEGG